MTYKLNKHKTNDEQLVVFRDKCPFYVLEETNNMQCILLVSSNTSDNARCEH
jgi:hypothetical protein